MSALREITKVAEKFADELHRWDDDRRVGWVLYLLELIDEKYHNPDAFNAFVERLQSALNDRLANGGW